MFDVQSIQGSGTDEVSHARRFCPDTRHLKPLNWQYQQQIIDTAQFSIYLVSPLIGLEQIGTYISLPGAGYDGHDGFAGRIRAFGNLQRGPDGSPG